MPGRQSLLGLQGLFWPLHGEAAEAAEAAVSGPCPGASPLGRTLAEVVGPLIGLSLATHCRKSVGERVVTSACDTSLQ